MVSNTDQDFNVSGIDKLKYSLNIQNPGSLTCENIKLPAPVASTISSGLAPDATINGPTIPAAVRPATVADPNAILSIAAINHASISGEMVYPFIINATYFATPLSTKTCLKAPPPPIINSIIAIAAIDSVTVFITSGIFLPLFNPKVNIARSTARSNAITGSPKKVV